ncbi:MAG: serine--tRNA ligase [Candidatus Hadarchaeum sp.]|uniref:serine--tRNA ligase n=1 Tax=Candidatus Hadarchaeum sp. TaxID=2883567 RepID=UPI00317C2E11
MRFELKGKLVFSGELSRIKEDIDAVIKGAEPVLIKGAPKGKETEAAKIIRWHIVGNELELELESGRYVRAHDALLRLAKILATELGKKHKLGLRGIFARDYRIILPIAEAPAKAVAEIKKLPHEVVVGDSSVEIHIKELTEAELRGRVVDRLVSMVEETLARASARAAEPMVVREGPKRPHTFKKNPFDVAKKLGWIRDFPGRGQWIYEEPYAKLLQAIEDIIIEEVARPLKFEEVMLPKLIPLEVMQRMPGYLDGVPEGMYYVSPPPRDPEAFKDFKQKLKLTKRVPVEDLKKILKEPAYVLAPAQCEPFYETFAFSHVRMEDLPVKQFDRSGWTYRWEGGGVEGLLRTQEFRRIEFVFLGSPEDVVSIRDAVVDQSIKVVDKLEMEWRLLVATPFYMREGVIGDGSDSSQVATYDVEVLLPYNDSWLEIGSYNVHRNKFVETFKIKEVKGRQVWTGCCGFGTSRWVVGFLAQHGFDPSRWPEPIRRRVGSLPPVPKVVE